MAIALPLRATSTQPKSYWLSQNFHSGHHALDMVGYQGQPLYAVDSGKVFASNWNGSGWAIGGGYTVIIDHWGQGGRRAKSSYAHMSRLSVATGQWVFRGQLIGYAGSTGNSTGPHVHFAVGECRIGQNPLYYNSYQWLNPYRYLRAHSFANGGWGGGDLVGSWHLGRNTFRVNAGVNLRTNRYVSSSTVLRTTTAASDLIFQGESNGTSYNGTTLWFRGYDAASRREVWVHSTLGRWVA